MSFILLSDMNKYFLYIHVKKIFFCGLRDLRPMYFMALQKIVWMNLGSSVSAFHSRCPSAQSVTDHHTPCISEHEHA